MAKYADKHHCHLCDSLLKLTKQATSHQLHVEVLNELRKLDGVSLVSGFEVGTSRDGKALTLLAYADYSEHEVHGMASDTSLLACLENKAATFADIEGGKRLFMPVLRVASQDVWVIEFADAADEEVMRRINILTHVYHNCDAHISSHKHDSLTGLENRHSLSERLRRVLHVKGVDERRAQDTSVLPSLCILDIDFFKRVNDEFGHLYGDEVLLLLAGVMKKTFRDNDYLYRYGGEEFVVLLDTKNEAETESVLERFRQTIDDYKFPQVGHVTVSIGFVTLEVGALPSTLFDHADKALYYAKEHGRNQVQSYQKLLETGRIEEEKVNIESELF
ncbi:MAG: GGDEF domain-containing protein [Ghiorsea sp.]